MELIEHDWARRGSGLEEIWHGDHEAIEELLVGHSVKKVADDHLLLDDGTLLKVIPNDGGCSCGAGDYALTELNGVDNIITKVEFVKEGNESWGEFSGAYRVFVFADHQLINLLTVEGDDGNGYYGTGFSILVRPAGGQK